MFVKLLIVRQIRFRHKSEEFAALDYGCTVEEHTAVGNRHANDNEDNEDDSSYNKITSLYLILIKQFKQHRITTYTTVLCIRLPC